MVGNSEIEIFKSDYAGDLMIARLEAAGLPVAMIGRDRIRTIVMGLYSQNLMIVKAGPGAAGAIKERFDKGEKVILNIGGKKQCPEEFVP